MPRGFEFAREHPIAATLAAMSASIAFAGSLAAGVAINDYRQQTAELRALDQGQSVDVPSHLGRCNESQPSTAETVRRQINCLRNNDVEWAAVGAVNTVAFSLFSLVLVKEAKRIGQRRDAARHPTERGKRIKLDYLGGPKGDEMIRQWLQSKSNGQ